MQKTTDIRIVSPKRALHYARLNMPLNAVYIITMTMWWITIPCGTAHVGSTSGRQADDELISTE